MRTRFCPHAYLVAALLALACFAPRSVLSRGSPGAGVSIVLQPLGPVDSALVERVRSGILDAWPGRVAAVALSPEAGLPRDEHYYSGARLRACRLLWRLEDDRPALFDKLVAVTSADLIAADGRYNPWSTFGVAWLGGRAAVVSTCRLRGPRPSPDLLAERLAKVANHEVGHLLGVDHCSGPCCVMADARASLQVLDNCSPWPCAECLRRGSTATAR